MLAHDWSCGCFGEKLLRIVYCYSYVYDITSEQLIVYFSPLLKRYSKTSSLGRTSARPSSPEIQRSSVDSRSSSSRHNPHTLLQVGSHHWLNRSISVSVIFCRQRWSMSEMSNVLLMLQRQNLQRKKWKMSSLDDVVVLHACELTFTTCTCLFWLCIQLHAVLQFLPNPSAQVGPCTPTIILSSFSSSRLLSTYSSSFISYFDSWGPELQSIFSSRRYTISLISLQSFSSLGACVCDNPSSEACSLIGLMCS